jgi:HTH-type transcriptional regulator/antitoxin HigA
MVKVEKYIQILQDFPPRPITSEEELEATQVVINRLLDKPELTPDEEDYLDVLGTLVYEYENQQEELVPDIYGVELLKVLIAERNLKQKDLVSIFKTESIVSDVLNEKRQLTIRHIQELAEFFKFPPGVFFPNLKARV